MNRVIIIFALAIAACSQQPQGVRVGQLEPAAPPPAPMVKAKTEPVFYNGKTYTLSVTPLAAGSYSLRISGMSAAQQKDAQGLATSAFHHFTCKDSQKTSFTSGPTYVGSSWQATARCV